MKYILKGFGFSDMADLIRTLFDFPMSPSGKAKVAYIVSLLASLRMFLEKYMGFDLVVFAALMFLIIAEFQTGLKVASRKRKERFKSRKFGRMILKMGVYTSMICMLHLFASRFSFPVVAGIPVNPFLWLYYTVFIAIVFQLFISWMENLGSLGYAETRSIAGYILRKLNKWFEFDGTKNNGSE